MKKKKAAELSDEFRAELQSGFGMFCLWDTRSFRHIKDARAWDSTFFSQSRFEKYIMQRRIVPIYFYGYGNYSFEIRPLQSLTKEELAANPLISQPYCIHSGGFLALSGIEYIGNTEDAHYHRILLKTKPGDYRVRIALLARREEQDEKRFCDVVVLIENIIGGEVFRTVASTFYPPEKP